MIRRPDKFITEMNECFEETNSRSRIAAFYFFIINFLFSGRDPISTAN